MKLTLNQTRFEKLNCRDIRCVYIQHLKGQDLEMNWKKLFSNNLYQVKIQLHRQSKDHEVVDLNIEISYCNI